MFPKYRYGLVKADLCKYVKQTIHMLSFNSKVSVGHLISGSWTSSSEPLVYTVYRSTLNLKLLPYDSNRNALNHPLAQF